MKHAALFLSLCMVFATTTASADTFIESFEGGSNEGSWTFGSPNGAVERSGGNPTWFFHDPFLDTFAPRPRTAFGAASEFTGNYREKAVTSVGIDLILFDVDFSADGRPLTVMLISDNATPGDFSDDWAAYLMGPDNVPLVGEGWLSYDFDILSQSETLPTGWQMVLFGPNSPVDPDWKRCDHRCHPVTILLWRSDLLLHLPGLGFGHGQSTHHHDCRSLPGGP